MTLRASSQQSLDREADKLLNSGEDPENRRASERRMPKERRRSARGLFELRARRDRIVEDRRQADRRGTGWRLAFWRR